MLDFPQLEQKILKFWSENKIFEKLRQKNQGKTPWSFLDGPITANNPMGVHHAWGRTYKDLFQRYKAMQGFDQRFQNGFDCQGLWVEVEVEKELGFKTKKDIETYGIDKFVEKCKERVRKYSGIQTQQSIRLGQWMDWENSYYTMSDENNYMIWYFLKKCWKDGLLYKGRDSVPWCPRCGTAISQHEILTEEYKLVTHEAIYFKLPILGKKFKGISFLVWTTTPWTIPANVALAINPEFDYAIFEVNPSTGSGQVEKLILLKDLAEKILGGEFKLIKTLKGKELKGLKYEGIFDDLPRVKKAREENPETFHTVVLDKDLVTAEEGTGIVHTAPGAGEEDFKLGQREKLSVIEVIDESAVYLDGLEDFSGKNAKENPEIILEYLKQNQKGKFFYKIEDYTHRYPTCWRCKKELVWRVVDEWYISMEKIREKLMEAAKTINWIPSFGLERELDWLKNMHDWLISKKRYWGLALPIFECQCGNFEVIGSKEELKERAIEVLSGSWDKFEGKSPHRPWVDEIKIKCSKCGKKVSRITDVGNPWLDAGIVPFSTLVDPETKKVSYTTDKKYWKKWFPIELVCESFPGQFKNWFYSIIVMSAVLEKTAPVKTIFGHASVRDEKGEEMHKSKGNAIWFDEAVEKVGADPMRWFYARQNPANNLLFGYHNIEEVKRKLLILYNSFAFFNTYVTKEEVSDSLELNSKNVLDKWILSRLNNLIERVKKCFDEYNASSAIIAIEDFFINDLSLWYIRRSRKRFHQDDLEKEAAVETLYFTLLTLLKIIAPIMPFFAEQVYQDLRKNNALESVHLCGFPETDKKRIDKDLETKMDKIREFVNLVLAERTALGIKVRQPLPELRINPFGKLRVDAERSRSIKNLELSKEKELLEILKEEVNVKEIVFDKNLSKEIELDTKITPELEEEGIMREIVRQIQDMRKKIGLKPKDIVSLWFSGSSKLNNILSENKETISKETKIKDFYKEKPKIKLDIEKEVLINRQKLSLGIKKK